jgi:hypothetical protein
VGPLQPNGIPYREFRDRLVRDYGVAFAEFDSPDANGKPCKMHSFARQKGGKHLQTFITPPTAEEEIAEVTIVWHVCRVLKINLADFGIEEPK